MNGLELVVGALVTLWFGWIGSIEWRLKNSVNKDRFGDLIDRIDRIEGKIDTLLESYTACSTSIFIPKDEDAVQR